jgi:hypothetical protein
MKLYEFNLLNTAEKVETLRLKAAYIGERTEEKYTFKLYQIDNFYVEEKWHTAFNECREILSFTSVNGLQPYLEVIDVTSLLVATGENNR